MAFNALPTATQERLIKRYVIDSLTSCRAPANDWEARQFFRTLDAATLAIWI